MRHLLWAAVLALCAGPALAQDAEDNRRFVEVLRELLSRG
jgi:hypothetical protein